MRRTGRFEKGAKLPLDFTHGIRYNKSRSKAMRRCVGMADEGDSKSLVLITRVGSTPTTGIKKRTSSACLGEFSFLSAARERVEQHGPALQGERSALRAVAQCAGDPHHRHKKENFPSLSGGVLFLSAACDHDLVVCIGRNCHAGLHHFQPVHEKIVEKYRGVIKAGVNRLDGVRFQPVTVNSILKGIGQLPVPIQKLLYGRFLLLTLIAEKRFQIARSERF